MPPRTQFFTVLLLFPIAAFAGDGPQQAPVDPFAGLTVSMTYPKNTVTHYSATPKGGPRCRLEGGAGGADESPSGLRPSQFRIDRPGKLYGRPTVLAAVPQNGGNAKIFGCFFSLPDAHPGVLFYAGDRYGPDSDDQIKTDVSSPCTQIVNKTQRSKLVVYNCPGKKGGKAPPLVRDPASEVASEPAKAPSPPAPPAPPAPESPTSPPASAASSPPAPTAGSCQWFAVLLCNRAESESLADEKRVGLAGFEVIHTNDYSNMASGWYCVVDRAASQAEAIAKAQQHRSQAPTSYALKGCP